MESAHSGSYNKAVLLAKVGNISYIASKFTHFFFQMRFAGMATGAAMVRMQVITFCRFIANY